MPSPPIRIEIKPPAAIGLGAILYPPLVVSYANNNLHTIFEVRLLDHTGAQTSTQHPLQGTLYGSSWRLGRDAEGLNGATTHTEYAVFPDLRFTQVGTYVLQFNVYEMDYGSAPPTTTYLATTRTLRVQVLPTYHGRQQPSRRETELLDRLSEAGCFIPPAPRG
ncbi:hypothetical protein F4808DRAFT_123495 [Astrocystis sublimbata]|nr:hypothetical protein F4808DRAFT_123495 [Astrocystis sublimbata]